MRDRIWHSSIMLVGISLLVVSTTIGQDVSTDKKTSNVEEFSAQDGILLRKDFYPVGDFGKCAVQVCRFSDLITGNELHGVRFDLEVKTKYSTDSKTAFLDPDEVGALIKSIVLIHDQVLASVPDHYVEVGFTARGGFQAGCFWADGKWSAYLKLEKYDSDSYVWFKPDKFTALLATITDAAARLDHTE